MNKKIITKEKPHKIKKVHLIGVNCNPPPSLLLSWCPSTLFIQ